MASASCMWSRIHPVGSGVTRVAGRVSVMRVAPPDRKSTRLNSSHANISYAVFCLKKKKHALTLTAYFLFLIFTAPANPCEYIQFALTSLAVISTFGGTSTVPAFLYCKFWKRHLH